MQPPQSQAQLQIPSFLHLLNSDDSIEAPSAIIGSRPYASVVGKDALDKAMQKLEINELEDKNI